jgi:UDP-N-acetylmuramoyl-L-alanyl-D-glutamate--2,6-diaminopimelate ligase
VKAALDALGIRRLVTDSRKIGPGDTFVAYVGEQVDGRDFIGDAIRAGAASVIWDKEGFVWNAAWQIPNLPVADLRARAGEIASHVYGDPSEKLWIIGVTGTNGKTSCTHWIAQALTRLGKKTAVIGTLGNGFPHKLSPTINTTPDAVALHGLLAKYLAEGAGCVAMEVSSHALAQGRVGGVQFDVALLTNLTRDHLDYHGDMAAYGAVKASLFERPELKYAILNVDDGFGIEILQRDMSAQKIAYGFSDSHGKLQVRGDKLGMQGGMLVMDVKSPWGNGRVDSPVVGRFNASNILGVLTVLLASGCGFADSVGALSVMEAVPGRMQKIGGEGRPIVVVDYAHTPDALENVLETLREIVSGDGALVCVFGCGGDRDPGKRSIMGKIASSLSDRVIVTSDNPRSEMPHAIIADIVRGVEDDYCVISDRGRAIRQAIVDSGMDDVVLLAGKGHEDYQEINGERLPFSDAETARSALELWGVR